MFPPPQAAIGLALLPVAWASSDSAAQRRGPGAGRRAPEEDLARYFPPGWQRESVPDWPAALAGLIQRCWAAVRRSAPARATPRLLS